MELGVKIKPPAFRLPPSPPPEIRVGLVTMQSRVTSMLTPSLQGGVSVKPGNILIDVRKLVTAGAQKIRDVVGSIKLPWIAPLAALIIWDRFHSLSRIELSENEAVLFWVMWMNCDESQIVEESCLFEQVNVQLSDTVGPTSSVQISMRH